MRRKRVSVLSDWIKNHKNGLIVFTESRKIGEADLLAQYVKQLGSHVEVATLLRVVQKDSQSILLGGDSNGVYTTWFRQILSNRYQPFLFLPRKEAELLLFALDDPRFKDWYLQHSDKSWLKDIDPKDIDKGLILYSGSSISNQLTNIDVKWLKKVLGKLIATKSIQTVTYWGVPRAELIKELMDCAVKKVVIYTANSSWSMNHPQIVKSTNLYSSVAQSDVLIIGENKGEFVSVPFPKLVKLMNQKMIIDPFYLFEQMEIRAFDWKYIHKGIK